MSNSSLNWTLLYLDERTGWLVQVALRVGGQGPGEEGRAQVYRYAGEPAGKNINFSNCKLRFNQQLGL